MSSLTCVLSSFKHNYKKYVVIVGFLATIAMVITLQYINESQSKHTLIYNSSRKTAFEATATQNRLLSRLTSNYIGTVEHILKAPRTDSLVSKITAKPHLERLINASKTQYPLTINSPYIMENPSLCTSVRNLSVLVIVHTAPDHFERRQTIRETWTNNTYYSHLGSVRVLFLLGRVKSRDIQMKMEQEFKEHGDLLQGDFLDAYKNLTHKGVMGYKWITERCRNTNVILKVDDDVVVNMFKFFTEYMPKYRNKSKQIFCNHIHPGTMLIIRDKRSKWYVDQNHFKGQKFYPRYCSGFMVMITNDIIPAIYRSATLTPFFWVDDVYLYGLAPGNVPGVHYNDLKKETHELNGQLAIKCYRNASRICNYLVTGAGRREVMLEIWSNMVKIHAKRSKQISISTERTTFHMGSSTGYGLFSKTKSSNQLRKENEKLDLIMDGKNLIVGKLVNKLEIDDEYLQRI